MTDEDLVGADIPIEVIALAESGESSGRGKKPADLARCPNCDSPINGPFCATCGQSQKNLNKQAWTLAGELLDDVFRLDSRVSKTLFALIVRPGFLTTEYFDGRRARYSPPVRLYLVISFLFFFLTPAMNNIEINTTSSQDEAALIMEHDSEDEAWDDIEGEYSGFNISWLSAEKNKALQDRLEKQVKKTKERIEEDPAGLWSEVMDLMSAVMFFMLPIFAIFLKMFYIGSGVYYAEHLLLALHNHCFLFIATLLTGGLELLESTSVGVVTGPMASLIVFWIPVYMYLSLKNTFGQSHGVTTFKFLFLGWIYILMAALGLAAAFIFEVLTL